MINAFLFCYIIHYNFKFCKEGLTRSTREIYKNIPAIPKNNHWLISPILPKAKPMNMPIRDRSEERQLYNTACFTDIPFFNNTAKSPETVKEFTLK